MLNATLAIGTDTGFPLMFEGIEPRGQLVDSRNDEQSK
jgi:hypothetical protein